jgi:hypothetical protein
MFKSSGIIFFTLVLALTGCSEDIRSPDFTPQLKSIDVSPSTLTLAPGTEGAFTAKGCFTTPPSRGDELSCRDISDSANWEILDPVIATISGPVVSAHRTGQVRVYVTLAGLRGFAELKVNGAILEKLEITPATSQVPVGLTQQFRATGVFSENGQQKQYTQDLTSQVDWSSLTPEIASINVDGVAKGVALNANKDLAVISAKFTKPGGEEISATAPLEVTEAVVIPGGFYLQTEPTALPEGARKIFSSYGMFSNGQCRNLSYEISIDERPFVAFFSSDDSLARVDGYAAGSSDETNTGGVYVYAVPTDIDPDPVSKEDSPGAELRPVVDAELFCKEYPVITGDIEITSTFVNPDGGFFTDTVKLALSDAVVTDIVVTPQDGAVSPGFDLQFSAASQYSDGSEIEITDSPDTLWTTTGNTIATVRNQNDAGLAEGVIPGGVSVVATINGVSGSAPLLVLDNTLTSIELSPDLFCVGATNVPESAAASSGASELTIVPGAQQLVAAGLFDDDKRIDNISKKLTWDAQYGVWNVISQNCLADPSEPPSPSPANVSNVPGEEGLVTAAAALAYGTSCIVATHPSTGVFGGATAIVLPVLDDDIAAIALCDAVKALLDQGEPVTEPVIAGLADGLNSDE